MAVMDFTLGQAVQIPAIQLTDGTPLAGVIRAIQGETVAIELDEAIQGVIPPRIDGNCMLTWKLDGIQRTCPILVRSKSQRALVAQVTILEQRESPRLRAEIKLVYELVPAEQVSEAADEVMAKVNTLGEPVSETARLLRSNDDPIEQIRQEIAGLRTAMDLISQKIDQLTMLVLSGEKKPPHQFKTPLSIVNCSSTGVGFMTGEPYEQGQYVRMRLTLCTTPQIEIECMGVVVRSQRVEADATNPAARYDTGVRYTHIHENDREHLIHYLFKVQRRILRDMKEARDEMA